jgi:glycosyltransferase involved in cell wall biosynthesis
VNDAVRPPHLLYVAWGFPPSRSGGVHRALATVNYFARQGWDVTVLTAPRETFLYGTGADVALESAVDPRVCVERVPFHWPAIDNDIRHWSLARVAAPRLWRRVRKRVDTLCFPEPGYGPWRRQLQRAAEGVHDRHPVDVVLATTNPHVAITAALHLHDRYGVAYVVDYRDAWSLDVFSGRRIHGVGSRVHRWERRSLRAATEIWVVNEALRRWHAETYPEAAPRIHVVANGFDTDVSSEVRPASRRQERGADWSLTYGYIGTVTDQVPMSALLAGWKEARNRDAQLALSGIEVHGHLGHYATPPPHQVRLFEDAAGDGLRYCGPLSKTAVGAAYAAFDVLLLVLGSGNYVTSGKVFEYLATGLPIVSVHDPSNAVSDVLRDYPRWHPTRSLAPTDVAEALLAAAEDVTRPQAGVEVRALEYARQFRRERQLRPRVQALEAAVRLAADRVSLVGRRGTSG